MAKTERTEESATPTNQGRPMSLVNRLKIAILMQTYRSACKHASVFYAVGPFWPSYVLDGAASGSGQGQEPMAGAFVALAAVETIEGGVHWRAGNLNAIVCGSASASVKKSHHAF